MSKHRTKRTFDWSHRHWSIRPLWLRTFSRKHRWLVRGMLGLVIIPAILLLVLARSPLTRIIVDSRLARILNLDVDADSVYVRTDGVLIMDRAKFRLPGIAGSAGQFLNVDRIEANINWWSLFTGNPKARGVIMEQPVLIVSQSINDGSLNIGSLTLPASSGSLAVPPIQLRNAGVEIGEDDHGHYQTLQRVIMDGFFRPSDREPGGYQFRLQETATRSRGPGERPRPGFLVNGALGESGGIGVQIENFRLDDWPARSVPRPSRERFADLNLRGDVPRASLRYTSEGGLTAELELHGVGMNLPLELTNYAAGVEGAEGPFPRFIRMSDVTGAIRFTPKSIGAQVAGLLEDLPYNVKLEYDGLSDTAPFRCEFKSEGFKVERNPSLLPYAPAEVRRWLKTFSSPTAEINTQMTVERGPPKGDAPGEITVAGDLFLSHGTAAYEKFPYRFVDMNGHFHFTQDEVRIVSVTGVSESGATIHADGLITPLDDTAEVVVNVDVKNAPIDHAMEEAFGPERGQVLRALFNQAKFDNLISKGLVQTRQSAMAASEELETTQRQLAGATPERGTELRAKIESLQHQIQAPIFEFRGVADVAVKVRSPRGKDQPYLTTIDIDIPKAGLVPDKFPLPIEAMGVRVHIENDAGRLTATEAHALGGGTAEVAASFNVPGRDDPNARPDIRVKVHDLPLSQLLIYALPTGGSDPGADVPVKRILRNLRMSGVWNGTVHIAPRGGKGDEDIGFDADFAVSDGAIDPEARSTGPLRVTQVDGRLTASESQAELAVSGHAMMMDPSGPAPAADGPIAAHLKAEFASAAEARASEYHAEASCKGLALSAPVETLVAVFSPEAADQIEQLRARFAPEGASDVSIAIASEERTNIDVDLAPKGDVVATVLDGSLALDSPTGRARVSVGDGVVLRCDGFAARAFFDDRPVGDMTLSGRYLLRAGQAVQDVREPLTLAWRSAPVESPLVGAIVRRRFGDDTVTQFDGASPSGVFDADVAFRAGPGQDGASSPDVRGQIRPRSLSLLREGVRVSLPEMGGSIEFEPGAGTIHQLSGRAPEWSAVVDGAWQSEPASGISARAQLSGKGGRLTPDLRVLLPTALRSVFDDLSLKVDGAFTVEDAALDIGRGADAAHDWTRFDGAATVAVASLEAGVAISDLSGRVEGSYRQEEGHPATFHLDVGADAFKVSGVSLGRTRGVIQSGTRPGSIDVASVAGECYGGRFSVRADISPPLPGGGREYEGDLAVAGARFHPLLQDMSGETGPTPEPEGHSDETSDFSRGQLDAAVSLAGITSDSSSRRGRGSFRISGGRVLNVPFMTRMVEVSNLALPTNSRLDYAAGDFYLEGGLITFNDLAVHSSSVAIEGYGTMTWPEKILDLRFNSRSERPIPILSQLVQGVRDELLTTTVKGKLGEQEVHLQQFPGTRRMLGRAMGSGESAESRRLSQIERRNRDRGIRPTPGGIRAAPPERTSAAQPEEPANEP